jgi:hypothetical protein
MRLAREAGFEHITEADYWHPYFARFAALAYAEGAAAEREWQPLTDEEISAISKSIPGETDLVAAKRVFARAIEAKLKEKNT